MSGAIAQSGCAGGSPLLHPAHVLPQGDLRAIAGLSGQAIASGMDADIRNAQASPAIVNPDGTTTTPTPDYTKGAMVATAVAPGIAPIVGARVGVGGGFEGGVTYLGRGGRLDMRKAFSTRKLALSVGVGFDAVFSGRATNPLHDLDMNALQAFGFDVPVIVGWRSLASLYQVWAGVRGGYDHVSVAQRSTEPLKVAQQTLLTLSADHAYVGALIGLAIGLRHIHVALELDASYVFLSGSFGGVPAKTSGLVLTPGSAISWDF